MSGGTSFFKFDKLMTKVAGVRVIWQIALMSETGVALENIELYKEASPEIILMCPIIFQFSILKILFLNFHKHWFIVFRLLAQPK
jgi:hypothetical protein